MGASGIQALEYMDTVLESRTGVTKYNQGLDANSLNKTATGISAIMSASQQRLELIARIFAETGVKQIFKLIQHCLMTYQNKSMIIRLTDEYVEVDPREWSAGYDMVINVGLGTGDKDQQLMHLMKMAEAQFQFLQMGAPIVTMENIYNTQAKIAENAGFKSIEQFWSDPKKAPPQQQQPDPAQQAAQAQAQAEQGKMQFEQQKAQAEFQQKAQASQQQIQLEDAKMQASQQTEQMKLQAMQELEAFKAKLAQETELKKAAMQAAASIEVARINADQADRAAGMQAQVDSQNAANEAQTQAMDAEAKAAEKSDAAMAGQETSEIMREILGAHGELLKVLSSPKRIVRGPDGRATGVEHSA
jgi:DNA polymerase III gamma/tau subunit